MSERGRRLDGARQGAEVSALRRRSGKASSMSELDQMYREVILDHYK